MFKIPIVRSAMKGAGQIPVKRGTRDSTPLVRAEAALAQGEVVVIYPEGTVTKRDDGLPMEGKSGSVRLSLTSGVAITPVASWGSRAVWQKSGRGSLKPRRPIWVKVGDPIDLSGRRGEIHDRDAVREMTKQVMQALTDLTVDLRDRYPKRWSE